MAYIAGTFCLCCIASTTLLSAERLAFVVITCRHMSGAEALHTLNTVHLMLRLFLCLTAVPCRNAVINRNVGFGPATAPCMWWVAQSSKCCHVESVCTFDSQICACISQAQKIASRHTLDLALSVSQVMYLQQETCCCCTGAGNCVPGSWQGGHQWQDTHLCPGQDWHSHPSLAPFPWCAACAVSQHPHHSRRCTSLCVYAVMPVTFTAACCSPELSPAVAHREWVMAR